MQALVELGLHLVALPVEPAEPLRLAWIAIIHVLVLVAFATVTMVSHKLHLAVGSPSLLL